MTSLLAFLLRLAVLALAVYAFIVLFEHGPSGFARGLGTEWEQLQASAETLGRAPPPPAPVAPSPTPSPAPSPGDPVASQAAPPASNALRGPERWRKLQERQIGGDAGMDEQVEIGEE